MATRAQVSAYARSQVLIREAAERELRRVLDRIDMSDPAQMRDVLLEVVPALVDKYGTTAASIAAEFFEDLLDSPAVLADPVAAAAIEASVRWGVDPAFRQGATGAAVDHVTGAMHRHVLQQGRDTLDASVRSTRGVSYARVLNGSGDCAFCRMLASRGFVYGTKSDAGEGNKFHSHCDCQIVPGRSDDDHPNPKQLEELYDEYAAVHESGMTGAETTAAMRKAYGIK